MQHAHTQGNFFFVLITQLLMHAQTQIRPESIKKCWRKAGFYNCFETLMAQCDWVRKNWTDADLGHARECRSKIIDLVLEHGEAKDALIRGKLHAHAHTYMSMMYIYTYVYTHSHICM